MSHKVDTYLIHEDNMPRLLKRLKTIQTKCEQLGYEFGFEQVGTTYKTMQNEFGREYVMKFIEVEVYGVAKVNNYVFVASLEHLTTEEGPKTIVRQLNLDFKIPHNYYNALPTCEHCNSNRHRKDTYLIYNTQTEEFKQVGKSCLKLYTNGLDASAVTQYISWFDELVKGQTPNATYARTYYSVLDTLALAVEYVNAFGFASMMTESPTAEAVKRYFSNNQFELERAKARGISPDTYSAQHTAACIRDWVLNSEETSGYMSNLTACLLNDYHEYRHFGLLVSAVPTYYKHLDKLKREAEKAAQEELSSNDTEYVGTVGERIVVPTSTFTCLSSWDTMYGTTFLYKIVDDMGHIFIWKTAKFLDGKYISLKGTIKAHTEFRGDKQTQLTRCSILLLEGGENN